MSERSPAIRLDARLSPAPVVSPDLLRVRPRRWRWGGTRAGPTQPLLYDDALRWLAVSDRIVSDEAARALLEVKEGKLHVNEGHARWSTYLRAFVPMTVRWCQQEMRRVRSLRDYEALSAAWAAGALSKSHLRVVLRVVTPESEQFWLERASRSTVRELEEMAAREAASSNATRGGPVARETSPGDDASVTAWSGRFNGAACEGNNDPEEDRPTRRIVMAPPGVALLVSEAVEVARKMAGYQVSIGAAVEMMAMETMAGLNESPASSHEEAAALAPDDDEKERPRQSYAEGMPPGSDGSDGPAGSEGADGPAGLRRGPTLGDHTDLRRELGIGWERLHRQMEEATGRWGDLPSDLREVLVDGIPPEGAGAHERVVFWAGLQGRLDAVRGRLLRIVEEESLSRTFGFAGFGQYVRERMGLSLRDARELVRLDRALDRLPAAFRMYASGRLGRRAAWLLTRIASARTDRAWTRFAMSHTLRLLEVVVEGALLRREADPQGWKRDGGLPPQSATFAEAVRACSHLKGVEPGGEATSRLEFLLDSDQRACYEMVLDRLSHIGGRDRPEWWGLALMARHFLNCYADEDRMAVPARLRRMLHRRVIERDNYTCRTPECLQRGGLEADHIWLRSRRGPDASWNLIGLCAADHRFMKHQAGTLKFSGDAPDGVTARMGSRTYFNDRLVDPAFDEAMLEGDPWVPARRRRAAGSWHRDGMTSGSPLRGSAPPPPHNLSLRKVIEYPLSLRPATPARR